MYRALLDLRLYVLHGRGAGILVLGNLENHKALPGADGLGRFTRLEAERLIFQHLGQGTALEQTKLTALRRGGSAGALLRYRGKVLTLHDFGLEGVGFLLRLYDSRPGSRFQAAESESRSA